VAKAAWQLSSGWRQWRHGGINAWPAGEMAASNLAWPSSAFSGVFWRHQWRIENVNISISG
jgi:hypothetical protein